MDTLHQRLAIWIDLNSQLFARPTVSACVEGFGCRPIAAMRLSPWPAANASNAWARADPAAARGRRWKAKKRPLGRMGPAKGPKARDVSRGRSRRERR